MYSNSITLFWKGCNLTSICLERLLQPTPVVSLFGFFKATTRLVWSSHPGFTPDSLVDQKDLTKIFWDWAIYRISIDLTYLFVAETYMSWRKLQACLDVQGHLVVRSVLRGMCLFSAFLKATNAATTLFQLLVINIKLIWIKYEYIEIRCLFACLLLVLS